LFKKSNFREKRHFVFNVSKIHILERERERLGGRFHQHFWQTFLANGVWQTAYRLGELFLINLAQILLVKLTLFYEQLLHAQIPKAQKTVKSSVFFGAFGI